MVFWEYWSRVTSKNKPESGKVTFNSDGDVVNVDSGSRGEHAKAIKEIAKNVTDGVSDAVKTIKDGTLAEISSIVDEAKEQIDALKDKPKPEPKVEAPPVMETNPVPDPVSAEPPKAEEPPKSNLVDSIIKAFKK